MAHSSPTSPVSPRRLRAANQTPQGGYPRQPQQPERQCRSKRGGVQARLRQSRAHARTQWSHSTRLPHETQLRPPAVLTSLPVAALQVRRLPPPQLASRPRVQLSQPIPEQKIWYRAKSDATEQTKMFQSKRRYGTTQEMLQIKK